MAWGGGGGMFGGGAAPMGGAANVHQVNSSNGLPFGGIPEEMQAGVDKVLAKEPDHRGQTPAFSHRMTERDRRPLNLRRMFAPHWRAMVLAVVLVVIETASLQARPLLMQIGIDHGILADDWGTIVTVGVLTAVAVVVTIVVGGARLRWTTRIAATAMYDLRVRIFAHLQRLSLDYYTGEKAGVIMTRMTSDVENLTQFTQEGMVQFVVQALTMVVVTVVLFTYNAELAFITVFLVVPPLLVLSLWFRAASDKAFLWVRDAIALVMAHLAESLAGVRVVTGHNRQARNIVEHRNVVGAYRDANDRTAFLQAVYGPGSEGIGFVAQALVVLIGGRMALRGEATVGEVTAFVLYLNAFFQPIQQLVQLYNTYQQGQSSIAKLRQLLLTEPSVAESPDAYELPPVAGEVVLEDVSFGYDPAVPVLRHVDLRIEAGETVCLVGPTGAGKSTIAKLVTRFYDPTEGRVLLDGHDLRDVTIASLRRQLGVVPQEPFLFAGTMRDNLSFGRPDATEDELWEAVDRVGLRSLVEQQPHGLDSFVHERGVSLSSGERQLLALGRAFLARPRVLVLDEATSNLDLESEGKVEAALDVLLEGRTAIIVAHRLSTAMKADRIVVVDHGGILEVGPHDELVALGGRYAEMYASWSAHLDGGEDRTVRHANGGRTNGGRANGGRVPATEPQPG